MVWVRNDWGSGCGGEAIPMAELGGARAKQRPAPFLSALAAEHARPSCQQLSMLGHHPRLYPVLTARRLYISGYGVNLTGFSQTKAAACCQMMVGS